MKRTKKTIQLTINLPMDFPDDWTNDDIEFYLNDSSYCLSNIINELDKYDKTVGCLCNICTAKVLE